MIAVLAAIGVLALPKLDDLETKTSEGSTRLETKPSAPCTLGGDALETYGPGYWGGVGSHRRAVHAMVRTAIGVHDVGIHRVDVDAAYDVKWFELLGRVELGHVHSGANSHGRFAMPIPTFALQYRSPCDAFAVDGGVRLLFPSPQATAADFQNALDAALTDGPANDVLWLPLADVSAQIYGHVRLRERNRWVAAGVDFGVRWAQVKVGSWLGPQRGLAGGSWFEATLASPTLRGLRLVSRVELGLSSLWPANEVVPFRVYGGLGISPFYAASFEVGGGFAMSPLSPTDLKSPQGFFALTMNLYLPLHDL
jgi:hypothetical protein